MDPSKFSVRVTNPTMVRQERFSYLPDLDITDKMSEYRSSNRHDKFAKASGSWCAPRKAQPVESSASMSDDSSGKELGEKNPSKNIKVLRRWSRTSHQRRIEELSRPKIVVRRVPRSHEIHSKISPRLENAPEIIKNSPSELTVKSSTVTEQVMRHRGPTDRIARLAEPKVYEPVAMNLLGKVEERALFAVASKRIAELATPKSSSMTQRTPGEKSNPFGVNPQALRATCSSRIEVLARPKKPAVSSSAVNPII